MNTQCPWCEGNIRPDSYVTLVPVGAVTVNAADDDYEVRVAAWHAGCYVDHQRSEAESRA